MNLGASCSPLPRDHQSVFLWFQVKLYSLEIMAFPGMSAPGLGGLNAGLDEKQLKEQQMIKYVSIVNQMFTYGITDSVSDATSDGIMSGKDCHVRCHGIRTGWSVRSLHVKCRFPAMDSDEVLWISADHLN